MSESSHCLAVPEQMQYVSSCATCAIPYMKSKYGNNSVGAMLGIWYSRHMNPIKLFLYARKSTDDLSRQVRSIDDQLAELRELARKEHLTVVEELVERQTAKKPGRPIFSLMLERIEKGEAEGILAWHPDRLSRNSVDAGQIIWLIDSNTPEVRRYVVQT